jgi:hypothetical protein
MCKLYLLLLQSLCSKFYSVVLWSNRCLHKSCYICWHLLTCMSRVSRRPIWFVSSTTQAIASCRNLPKVPISSKSFQAINLICPSHSRLSFKHILQFTAVSTQATPWSLSKGGNMTAELSVNSIVQELITLVVFSPNTSGYVASKIWVDLK